MFLKHKNFFKKNKYVSMLDQDFLNYLLQNRAIFINKKYNFIASNIDEIIEKDLPKTKLDNEAKQNIEKIIRNVNDTGFYSKNKFHSMEHISKVIMFSFLLG